MEITTFTRYGFFSWCKNATECIRSIPQYGYERKSPDIETNSSYKKMYTIVINNIPREISRRINVLSLTREDNTQIAAYNSINGENTLVISLSQFRMGCDDKMGLVIYGYTNDEYNKLEILYETKITFPPLIVKGDTETCAICTGRINLQMCEILDCHHVFHTKCLWKYFLTNDAFIRKPLRCSTMFDCEHGDICHVEYKFNHVRCPLCRQVTNG